MPFEKAKTHQEMAKNIDMESLNLTLDSGEENAIQTVIQSCLTYDGVQRATAVQNSLLKLISSVNEEDPINNFLNLSLND